MDHKVAIVSEKITFEVQEDESIVDGALRKGIGLPYSCRNGQCGTCKAKVQKGTWKYLHDFSPDILTRFEIDQGMVVLCKAAPLEALQIEFDHPLEERIEPRVLKAKIEQIEPVASDVIHLTLRLPEGESLPFRPGHYVDFLLEENHRRSFSLASLPSQDSTLEFHIRKIPGGYFSERLFTDFQTGDEIRFEGPLGSFRLNDRTTRPMIFVAGGTGFAPIKPMLERILVNRKTEPVWFYWGVRNPDSLYMDELVKQWENQYEGFHYIPVVSEPDKKWMGKTGPVHNVVVHNHSNLSGFDMYMAGPPAMINAARTVFLAHRLMEDRLFCDTFLPGYSLPEKTKNLLVSRIRRIFQM